MTETARDKLLLAIRDLILERGFGGTSVDAICHRAGVSKGSFFHYFKTKEEAAQATLEWFFDSMKAAAQQTGFGEKSDPVDRLMAYLDGAVAMIRSPSVPNGCLLGTLALETSETHPEIRKQVEGYLEEWSGSLTGLLQDALGDDDTQRAASLAEHLLVVFEGGLLLAKAKQNMSSAEASIVHFKHYVQELIRGRPEKIK